MYWVLVRVYDEVSGGKEWDAVVARNESASTTIVSTCLATFISISI